MRYIRSKKDLDDYADKRREAEQWWDESRGEATVPVMATRAGVTLNTIRRWKKKWKVYGGPLPTGDSRAKLSYAEVAAEPLTEQEEQFCKHFVQCLSATTSVIRLGNTQDRLIAQSRGWQLMGTPKIRSRINELKKLKAMSIDTRADDVIDLHLRIAFADMHDFIGRHLDDDGRIIPLGHSDGGVISEVTQDALGNIRIKLENRHKSLEFLERFFLMNPLDKHKIEWENKKLALEQSTINAATPVLSYDITELMSPVFHKLHEQIANHEATYWWVKGGRNSTKSSFLSLEIVDGIMQHPKTHGLVFREVYNTTQDSVYEQLLWAINMLGVQDSWRPMKSPLKLVYIPTGQQILFRGMDSPFKTKSIKAPGDGYYRYLWFEELDQFEDMQSIKTVEVSAMRGGDEFDVFYSYNPPASLNSWVNVEAKIPTKDRVVHNSSYLDVPLGWLPEAAIIAAEHMRLVNIDRYNNVYLGVETGTGGEVFYTLIAREIQGDEILAFDRIKQGLDWGYGRDPLAWGRGHYDKARQILYIYDEIYGYQIKNRDAAESIIQRGLPHIVTTCDSAEPKSIMDLRDMGVLVQGAKKGPDSVDHGVKWLQDLEHIVIDPIRCPNTWKEFSTYELERNMHGLYKSGYPDTNNHTIDCWRYATEDESGRSAQIGTVRIAI